MMDYDDAVDEINEAYNNAKEFGLKSMDISLECLKLIAARCNKYLEFMAMLEDLRNELNKVIEYEQPFNEMTQAKWDKLYKYNLKPILDEF